MKRQVFRVNLVPPDNLEFSWETDEAEVIGDPEGAVVKHDGLDKDRADWQDRRDHREAARADECAQPRHRDRRRSPIASRTLGSSSRASASLHDPGQYRERCAEYLWLLSWSLLRLVHWRALLDQQPDGIGRRGSRLCRVLANNFRCETNHHIGIRLPVRTGCGARNPARPGPKVPPMSSSKGLGSNS